MRAAILMLAILTAPGAAASDRVPVEIRVDPRVELLGIVQVLAGEEPGGAPARLPTPLEQRARERFAAHAGHDAVRRTRELAAAGFTRDAPVTAVLQLGPLPELRAPEAFDDDLERRAGGRDALRSWCAALRAFAEAAPVAGFLQDESAFHASLVAEVAALVPALDAGPLQRYAGEARASHALVLATLQAPVAYGPTIRDGAGGLHAVAVLGPVEVRAGRPLFGTPESLSAVAWHELGHSYVIPLIAAQPALVESTRALFEPHRGRLASQGYGTWTIALQETVLRAVTVRLHFRERGERAGIEEIAHHVERGFVLVPALAVRLMEYEADRASFPALRDFVPDLGGALRHAAASLPRPPRPDAPCVVRTVPASGAQDVDPDLAGITVEFDRDMDPRSWSWVRREASSFPGTSGPPRWTSPRTCVLPVRLDPARAYALGVNGPSHEGFRSVAGIPAEPAVIAFTTRSR